VAYPRCGVAVVWNDESRFRPFCSERCQLIDFGVWATESYRIAVVEDDRDSDDSPPRAP
jgi:endogenous inhibitor of DNA gyrase (YacG/DUF329 family)